MNKLVLCCFIAVLIVGVTCQQFPSYPTFPTNLNDPNHPCNRPGANCKIQSRFAEESSVSDNNGNSVKWSQICDERGCQEFKVKSGSTQISISFGLLSLAAIIAFIKNF